ncbi:MAG: hypothetical protein I8H71_00320 [Xanthomonadaceae bacterium]|nr:hypothetical protein [Xanthomonadaceae bacterium]MBH2008117.1 hypothetical protein [Xanthomonadaceae bacterium]
MENDRSTEITDHLQRLQGQVDALTKALQGLILAQPYPHEAATVVNQRVEKFVSAALASKESDAYLDGVQRLKQQLFPKPNVPLLKIS